MLPKPASTVRYRLSEAGGHRFLTNPLDVFIGKSIEMYGSWSKGEIDFFRDLLKPGQNVIEIGSNIGAHSVHIAEAIRPDGRLYALEPQRLTFQLLCANLALNSLQNVFAWQMGASDYSGTIRLKTHDFNQIGNFGLPRLEEDADGEDVAVIRLDDRLEGFPKIALLKIDAEGHEMRVLEGAGKLIARDKPVLYVENEDIERSPVLLKMIHEMGYNLYWHTVRIFDKNNETYSIFNSYGDTVSINVVGFPVEMSVNIEGSKKITDFTAHPRHNREKQPKAATE